MKNKTLTSIFVLSFMLMGSNTTIAMQDEVLDGGVKAAFKPDKSVQDLIDTVKKGREATASIQEKEASEQATTRLNVKVNEMLISNVPADEINATLIAISLAMHGNKTEENITHNLEADLPLIGQDLTQSILNAMTYGDEAARLKVVSQLEEAFEGEIEQGALVTEENGILATLSSYLAYFTRKSPEQPKVEEPQVESKTDVVEGLTVDNSAINPENNETITTVQPKPLEATSDSSILSYLNPFAYSWNPWGSSKETPKVEEETTAKVEAETPVNSSIEGQHKEVQ